MKPTTIIQIDSDQIPVRPDETHEYVVETALVAKGYGVSEDVIRQHKTRQAAELIEGKHWVSSVTKCYAGNLMKSQTFWTKRGVVRLGFFIKSKRAKLFRDLAEDLVIAAGKQAQPTMSYPEALRRLADAVERGDKSQEALSIIAPQNRYGSITASGKPRERLVRAYFRSGLNADGSTRHFLELQREFTELFELAG